VKNKEFGTWSLEFLNKENAEALV